MPISTDRQWKKGRNKHPSGFCNENGKPGQHEGTKPKSGGKPLPTCPDWQMCPCVCHQNVDKLFEQTGMERIEVPNSEFSPVRTEIIMPDVIDPLGSNVASNDTGVIGHGNDERPVNVPYTPAAAPLAQRRTETGRAARGGLEAQVWDACQGNADLDQVTPKVIAEWIVEKYKIPTPSTGAINAVWERWVKLEFAETAKKPNRFVKFLGVGSWEELVRLKTSAKVKQRSSKSAAKRGFR